MKRLISLILLTCIVVLGSSCVSRTTERTPASLGAETGKIVETKTIWFWQDDF